MTTGTVGSGAVSLRSTSFSKFAGVCAILAGATGFLINPILYVWLGLALRRARSPSSAQRSVQGHRTRLSGDRIR